MAPRLGNRDRARRWLLRLALTGASAAFGGCFSPATPPCAFTCISAGNLCPDEYTCGADGLCHRDGAQDMCGLRSPYEGQGGAGGAAGHAGAGGQAGGGGAGAGGHAGAGGQAGASSGLGGHTAGGARGA